MDGREAMPSFYLNRGVSGSGSNPGSSSHGGGLQVPPPGFKNQSNPNISLHGHSNIRVASSFHMDHNPSPNFPRSITMSMGGSGGGGGGASAASMVTPGSGSGSDPVVKKKRGRPRKYGPDGSNVALRLTPVSLPASPGSISPTPKKNRGRPPGSGRKQRLANVGEWMHNSAGLAFTPHIIHISAGEDVAEKILSFAQQRPRALCVLSGNGAVSAVSLRQFSSSGGTVTYEGRFEILCLSGSYLLAETGGPHNRTGGLSISVCSADGHVVGGPIGGRLIASGLVQVVVCSFVFGGNNTKQSKTKTEDPLPSSDVQLNDKSPPSMTTSSTANQHLAQNSLAIAWPPDSRSDLRNAHTEIDLTRG